MNAHDVKLMLLDFLYPASCPFCGKEAARPDYCCKECAEKLAPPQELCSPAPLSGFLSVTAYNDYSKKAIYSLKDSNDSCAAALMARLMYKRLCESDFIGSADIITYVPMHRRDRLKRGYNQSRLLAEELSRLSGIPCERLLKKPVRTAEQKSLSAAERRENLRGAFSYVGKSDIRGFNILLIDDVSTTGSTLRECASQLISAGAKSVFGLVFAKTENFT